MWGGERHCCDYACHAAGTVPEMSPSAQSSNQGPRKVSVRPNQISSISKYCSTVSLSCNAHVHVHVSIHEAGAFPREIGATSGRLRVFKSTKSRGRRHTSTHRRTAAPVCAPAPPQSPKQDETSLEHFVHNCVRCSKRFKQILTKATPRYTCTAAAGDQLHGRVNPTDQIEFI